MIVLLDKAVSSDMSDIQSDFRTRPLYQITCQCCRCSWWFHCLQCLSDISPTVVADKLVTILQHVLTTDYSSVC